MSSNIIIIVRVLQLQARILKQHVLKAQHVIAYKRGVL